MLMLSSPGRCPTQSLFSSGKDFRPPARLSSGTLKASALVETAANSPSRRRLLPWRRPSLLPSYGGMVMEEGDTWVRMWVLRLPLSEKHLPQSGCGHLYGRSPVCLRLWIFNVLARRNDAPHIEHTNDL